MPEATTLKSCCCWSMPLPARPEQPPSGLHSRWRCPCSLSHRHSNKPQKRLSLQTYSTPSSSFCSLSLTDPTAVCLSTQAKDNNTHTIPSSEANFLCLSVSLLPLILAFRERKPCGEQSPALALSAEPVSLLPAVHRDRRVNELRVLDNLSTKSQTSFIRETESSLISLS